MKPVLPFFFSSFLVAAAAADPFVDGPDDGLAEDPTESTNRTVKLHFVCSLGRPHALTDAASSAAPATATTALDAKPLGSDKVRRAPKHLASPKSFLGGRPSRPPPVGRAATTRLRTAAPRSAWSIVDFVGRRQKSSEEPKKREPAKIFQRFSLTRRPGRGSRPATASTALP